MYHSFLIHSSADGHLGCFHDLAIVTSSLNLFPSSAVLCLTWDFSNFLLMDCQFQIVISQVSFGGISVLVAYLGPQGRTLRNLGHRNQSPESTKSPETEGSGDMLNNTEHPRVQLHFLYTKENERKTQGKGEFICLFLLCCHLSLLFSGFFLCSMCPFKPLWKGFMPSISPALLGARKFSKNVLLYNTYTIVVTLLPRSHLTMNWEMCFIWIYIY